MKILYLNDYMGTMFCTPEEEVEEYNRILMANGFPAAEKRDSGNAFSESFDALIFDWGAAQMGNSVIEMLARYLVRCAIDNPSRAFLVRSAMSEWEKHSDKAFAHKPVNHSEI